MASTGFHTEHIADEYGLPATVGTNAGDVAIMGSGSSLAKRQRAYLAKEKLSNLNAWRPFTIHRRGANTWLFALHDQFHHAAFYRGFDFFQKGRRPQYWKHWTTYLAVNLAIDFGSDGLAAVYVSLYKLRVNVGCFLIMHTSTEELCV